MEACVGVPVALGVGVSAMLDGVVSVTLGVRVSVALCVQVSLTLGVRDFVEDCVDVRLCVEEAAAMTTDRMLSSST